MSHTRVTTARPTTSRRRGGRNTYQHKRNHSPISNDDEKQHFFVEEPRSGNSNRKGNKRGRVPYHLKNYRSERNYEASDIKFVQQDNQNQEACNFPETSPKSSNASRSSYPPRSIKDQAVSNSSDQDKSLIAANLSKHPKHAKNPIFVEELVNRFHSILPPSIIPPEEPPQKILSNQGYLNISTQSRDYDLPNLNKTQHCVEENNPHYPFLHCNIKPQFSKDEDSFSKINRSKNSILETSGYKKKIVQNPASADNKKERENTYSKTNVSNHKQTYKHQTRPETSHRQIETHQQSFKAFGNVVDASPVKKPQDHNKANINQTQTSEDSMEFDLFSQIKAFVSNNKSTLQKASSECLSKNIQGKNKPKTYNQRFTEESSFKTNFDQTQPPTINVENVNKTLNSSSLNSQTNNNEMSAFETSSYNYEKLVDHQLKTPRSLLHSTPLSFTDSKKMSAQDRKSSENFVTMKNPNRSKNPYNTEHVGFLSKGNNENKHLRDFNKRNEILKAFGFPGKTMGQDFAESQAKQDTNPSSESVVIPQEEPFKSNKISPDNKDSNSGSAARPPHSQQESFQHEIGFQKQLEIPRRNNNVQNNDNSGTSNVPYQFLKSTSNASSYELPTSSHMYTQKSQLPHLRSTFEQSRLEINRTGNAINLNKCTNPSILSKSDLNNAEVAGGNVFNIQRPANVPNQRVATRTEALRRLQDHYAEDLVEYQQKEKEKAAKKLEEKLARYKYVDQGYRLTEGFLDEAAGGFDPDAAMISEEEIRMRQQEQLNRDAVAYMELEKKKNEQLKKREEEKKKKEMEKYKHVSHGYRLGGNENLEGPGATKLASDSVGGRGTSVAAAAAAQAAAVAARVTAAAAAGVHGLGVPVSHHPDAAQFTESEEEVRMKQQEQLNRDAVVYMENEKTKNEQLKKREEEKKKKEMEKYKHVSHGYRLGGNENLEGVDAKQVASDSVGGQGTSAAATAAAQAAFVSARIKPAAAAGIQGLGVPVSHNPIGGARPKTRSPQNVSPQIVKQDAYLQTNSGGPAMDVQERQTADNSSQAAMTSISNVDALFLKFLQANEILKPANNEEAEKLRLTLLSQLQNVLTNTNKKSIYETQSPSFGNPLETETNIKSKDSTSCSENSTTIDTYIKPATYVVKSAAEGPILMIRPSQEALQQSISKRVALEDFDKHGQSALYIPHIEQAPVYSNNRFEQKTSTNTFSNSIGPIPEKLNESKQKIVSNVVETHSVQKSFDQFAKSTRTIPKQKEPEKNMQTPPLSSPTTSSNESEPVDVNFQEELRAARLRMQMRYDETLKKQVKD